ncbi:MAG: replication-associated recombination protein A [candidate division Zixibacteria bacterium]|nr:replication-associated recombination protein A [candidate division Zixibacteria bacterium]NIR62885.1 replication-associated recombination protein A [candidate division Zixibacteria bacterium]NIS15993.1 replication-associated recombination protein A [candidate division Zixibacteria bacterium]NIS44900.1 replication-associated recombination protein A [candidate division Zixibacteria bacterium]NIT52402.1 replication-associated recombination protein A [candidate division Zixibacteria bacterium]
MGLFEEDMSGVSSGQPRPLADRMRPRDISEILGQDHLLGEGAPLKVAIESRKVPSMILWGPPGSGKTTIASVIARTVETRFIFFSAVTSGIKHARQVVNEAEKEWLHYHKQAILFVDEIHRFNKAQQDFFLPHVEKGVIILIGATTENPSFEVISPLLSRCTVFTLNMLAAGDIKKLLKRALKDKERGLGDYPNKVPEDVLDYLAAISDGDARRGLSYLEMLTAHFSEEGAEINVDSVGKILQKKTMLYDKSGEEHYNLISALHKSVRGSDVDASLYWLARMLESGEDPMYLARRLVRMAVEDIGVADPNALTIALNAKEAYHFLGTPEGELALAECVVYLATAPKSNRIYTAFGRVQQAVRENPSEPVPLHIRNAPTGLMKDLGYGKDYKYAHDYEEAFIDQEYLPESLKHKKFYTPSAMGFEKKIEERMAWWEKKKKELSRKDQSEK